MAHFTSDDGLTLHYTDRGSGPPVLCLAGLTRDSRDFDYVAPHLGGVRLILPDYRGRGRSDRADDPMTYTIPREAQDQLALLDHLGLERAAILGTSRGGLIALALAGMAPDRLTGVAFNDIGPQVEAAGLAAIMGYLGRKPTWKTLEEAAEARASGMTGFEGVPMARWREEVEKFYTEGPEGLALSYDPRLREAVEAGGAQQAPDLWPLFDALAGKPLAVIRAENSNILAAETVARMRARRPDMCAAEVPGRGHVPFLDEPEALEVLHAWIKDLPR